VNDEDMEMDIASALPEFAPVTGEEELTPEVSKPTSRRINKPTSPIVRPQEVSHNLEDFVKGLSDAELVYLGQLVRRERIKRLSILLGPQGLEKLRQVQARQETRDPDEDFARGLWEYAKTQMPYLGEYEPPGSRSIPQDLPGHRAQPPQRVPLITTQPIPPPSLPSFQQIQKINPEALQNAANAGGFIFGALFSAFTYIAKLWLSKKQGQDGQIGEGWMNW